MSLLKAYNKVHTQRDYVEIEQDFLAVIDAVSSSGVVTQTDVEQAVLFYTEYSLNYLVDAAQLLREEPKSSQTMKFMNSYLAELTNKAGIPYFNKEEGYSIVDKAVQVGLDKDVLLLSDITKIVEDLKVASIKFEEDSQ